MSVDGERQRSSGIMLCVADEKNLIGRGRDLPETRLQNSNISRAASHLQARLAALPPCRLLLDGRLHVG